MTRKGAKIIGDATCNPPGHVLLGLPELTIIDNMASRRGKLAGNVSLDAQTHGILLLSQEDGHPVAVWPMSAVKKVELIATDIPQDKDKILSIFIIEHGGFVPHPSS